MKIECESGVGRNKFVEITLAKTLELAWEVLCAGELDVFDAGFELLKRVGGDSGFMNVVVLANNDFYSQREQVTCLVV